MSGRRSHVRYVIVQSPEGKLRVMQDVLVQGTVPSRQENRPEMTEMVAISRQPGVMGERVALDVPESEVPAVHARIVDSQPLVLDGTVRHRLRLQPVAAAVSTASPSEDRHPVVETSEALQ